MDVPAKIRKQVEFYFSDSNFPFDKFLYFLSKKNSEGWIPLETVADFKKMRMITEDKDVIVSALRSGDSDLVELNEAGDQIRRTKPLVEQNFVQRSVYAKGFPLVDAGAEKPVDALMELQDKIAEFFEEHGKVLAVRLRKTDGRPSIFKGSVYVEFEKCETAEEVAKKSLQYEGQDLILKTKRDYLDEKSEKYKDAPQTSYKKRSFNAFKYERNSKVSNNKNKKQRNNNNKANKANFNNEKYSNANHRLLKFKNAKDVSEAQVKELVGSSDVESIVKNEDGTGYVLLSKKESRKVANELKGKSVDVRFFAANNDESKEFAGESVPEPSIGEKRKAEDDIKEEA